jgi:hypothetical protein
VPKSPVYNVQANPVSLVSVSAGIASRADIARVKGESLNGVVSITEISKIKIIGLAI